MPPLSRRRFLTILGGAGAAWLGGARRLDAAGGAVREGGDAPFSAKLRIPARNGLLAERRLAQPLELVAGVDRLPVFNGFASNVWNYAADGDAHDPLLVARRGDDVDVTLWNRLGQDTTIHWHGLAVDEANDGSGLHPVHHGERRRCAFRIDNRAALYWYHAHPHFHTGEQLHQGMAGLLLVEDDEELALRERLGLAWLERDIPLMIADKQLAQRNELAYKAGADDWIGNRVLVNWTPEPYLEAERALYRFRIANASNARMFRLAFTANGSALPLRLIGTDGGLLDRPMPLRDCYVAPAQRVDVLLDLAAAAPGARIRLRSLAYDAMENDGGAAGEDPMLEHPGATPMGGAMDLMELRIGRAPARRTPLPRRLAALPAPAARGEPSRRFRFRISERGRWLINDWNFLLTGHAPAFEVVRGAKEVWEFANEFRSMPHPIHLHGFQFRVLERRGSPPQVRARAVAAGGLGAQDLGLLDTVVVWPGEHVRIAIDFAQRFSGTQTYMLHCHNLEHEDQGMMVAFSVRDA